MREKPSFFGCTSSGDTKSCQNGTSKLLAIEFPIGKKITSNQYNLFQKWCNRNRDIMKKISSNIYRNSNDYKLIVYESSGTDIYTDDLYSVLQYAKTLISSKNIILDNNILDEEYNLNNKRQRR